MISDNKGANTSFNPITIKGIPVVPSALRLILASSVLLPLLTNAFAAESIPVRSIALTSIVEQEQQDAPAIVRAQDNPLIAAEISGRIREFPHQPGDPVQKGELLVAIDCRAPRARQRLSEAELATAKARLRFAKSQLQRAHELVRRQSISDELLDQRRFELADAKATVERGQADLALRQLDIEHCRIKAPFDAILSERLASVGTLASPGTALLRLVRRQGIEVSARLDSEEGRSLAQARTSHFFYQGKSYPLTLYNLSALFDSRSRTQEVRLRFNDGKTPAIGSPGRLVWYSGRQMIAADYLVRRAGQLGIFVREGSPAIARFIPLPDAREGRPALIPPRLLQDTGTRLITDGRQLLHDGQAIEEDSDEAVETPA